MAVNKTNHNLDNEVHRNEDAITGEPGSHPIGTGVGAAIDGAAAGATAGLVGGPAGAIAGAVIGGVAGGFAGKAIAEDIDPTVEDAYWRNEYVDRPYYNESYEYSHYRPAYQSGWEAFYSNSNNSDSSDDWVAREATARRCWEDKGGDEYMTWKDARPAAIDSYERVRNQRSPKPR